MFYFLRRICELHDTPRLGQPVGTHVVTINRPQHGYRFRSQGPVGIGSNMD